MTHPDQLGPADADHIRHVRERDNDLDRLTSHVRRFATMMTGLSGEDLEQWIIDVERDP